MAGITPSRPLTPRKIEKQGQGYTTTYDESLKALKTDIKRLIKKHNRIKAENERMKQALKEYANRNNWRDLALHDRGKLARKTLGKVEE